MKFSTFKRMTAMFLVNHILCGTFAFERKRKLLNAVGYQIGEGPKIVGPLYCTGMLHIGRNCWIGRNFTVHGNGSVEIGDACDIAPEVAFLTGGHSIGTAVRRAGAGQTYQIRVGSGCWIGARATIIGNRTIGSGVMITACACVTDDLEDNIMAGGVPTRKLKDLD